MILTTERTPSSRERLADWYAKAALTQYPFLTGPRFGADFESVFRREYEAEQIADARAGFDEEERP